MPKVPSQLNESGFPQPTGELKELSADAVVLALGQETDLSLVERTDGIDVTDGIVQVSTESAAMFRSAGTSAARVSWPPTQTVAASTCRKSRTVSKLTDSITELPSAAP